VKSRAAITLVLALWVLGCGSLPPDHVRLGIAPNARRGGCYLTYSVYDLVADPTSGTAVRSDTGEIGALYWPPGYTGHRVGSEVEVRNPDGKVVATTGGRYAIWPADAGTSGRGSGLVAGCINPA
jgi:hypothetical protein